MTLDTYTHLFEQTAHGADVRAQLARSDFAMLLSRTLEPRLLAGKLYPLPTLNASDINVTTEPAQQGAANPGSTQ